MANQDVVGGFYTGTGFADKTFYGFKLNNSTGSGSVEIITSVSGDVVKLPEPDYISNEDDYKIWVWSSDILEFYLDQNTGRLVMKSI
jgi:uncharacterized protein (DUF1499 family)